MTRACFSMPQNSTRFNLGESIPIQSDATSHCLLYLHSCCLRDMLALTALIATAARDHTSNQVCICVMHATGVLGSIAVGLSFNAYVC